MKLDYTPPGPVGRECMLDDSFVRGIRGPVGSGTSSLCLMELLRRWLAQEPNAQGVRKSRTAIIRNTAPMLRTTTMKSYAEWLKPEAFGEPKMAPPPFEHAINLRLPDGTELAVEVLFLALDTPDDIRKLLSLELTTAFINEAREVPKEIVDGVTQRLRRFPAWKDGGATFSGLIMDTNAPDDDHWWPIMAGEAPAPEWMSEEEKRNLVLPADWRFWCQPPAMIERRGADGRVEGYDVNPAAENIQNLDPKYYPGQIAGKSKAWIDVYIMNRLGSTADGRPVQPDFVRETHVAGTSIVAVPGVDFILGVDFGLTPAAVFFQRVGRRWLALREISLINATAVDLAKQINRVMAEEFPNHKIGVAYGDPAGDQRAGTDGDTPLQVLRAYGIPARKAAQSNDPEPRRAALAGVLQGLYEGRPRFISDPSCKVLNAGLGGSWCYKRVRGAGSHDFSDQPEKTRFSHTCEAAEYALLGGGEARDFLLNKQRDEAAARHKAGTATVRDPLARLNRPRSDGGRRWGSRP